jgi:hypothetical protein
MDCTWFYPNVVQRPDQTTSVVDFCCSMRCQSDRAGPQRADAAHAGTGHEVTRTAINKVPGAFFTIRPARQAVDPQQPILDSNRIDAIEEDFIVAR